MITYIKRVSNKRRVLWVIMLLAASGGTATYFYLYPERLPDWATRTSVGRDLQTTTVYKWQDGSGAWHITDQPPPEGIGYESEKYNRDANVLPLPPKLQR